ncbi:MAG: response regulator [Candidatus Cloacimonadota bacterium]
MRISLSFVVTLLLFLILNPALSGVGADRHIHVGVLAHRGKDKAIEQWNPTMDYLSREIPGYEFHLIPLSFDEMYHYIDSEQVDMMISNSSFAAEIEYSYAAIPLATMQENFSGRGYNSYGATIFCRADAKGINKLEDLKGKSFVAVDPLSFAGWHMAQREFKAAGMRTPGDFSSIQFAGTHDNVVKAVLEGKAAAGVVRTSILESLAASGEIKLSDFKIINAQVADLNFPWLHSTRLYPNWSINALTQDNPALYKNIAMHLISMSPTDSAAVAAGITGWTIPLSNQPVLACLRELGIGPYKNNPGLALREVLDAYRWWIVGGLLLFFALLFLLQKVSRLNRKISKSNLALKKSEANFRLLSEQYQSINEHLEVGVSLISPEMQVVVANRRMRTWFPSVNTNSISTCYDVFEGSIYGEVCENCPAKLSFADGEIHYHTRKLEREGKPFILRVTTIPIRDENSQIAAVLETVEDITEKELFTQEIETQKAILEAVLDAIPDVVGILDKDLNVLRYNRTGIEMFGLDRMKLEGKKCYEIFDQSEICRDCHVKQTLKTKAPAQLECFHPKLDRYMDFRSTPVFDSEGNIRLIVEQVRDISQRKAQEKEQEYRGRYQRLVAEISSDFISASIANIDDKINSMLQKAGKFFEVDQSYLIQFSENMQMMQETHNWTAPGFERDRDKREYSTALLPWWFSQISARKPVFIQENRELPPEAKSENKLLETRGIRSMISLPILAENRVMGVFGMNCMSTGCDWEEKDVTLLQVLANTLADAIVKTESEKEILLSKEMAEAASKAKSEFLANMSHELRTPLNGVIGFTDLLLETPMNSQQKLYLENAHNSAHALLEVISEILDFSKIEAGKMELEPVKTDLIELAESCMDVVVFQASRKNLELVIKIDPDIPRYAVVDPIRLKQVLINLLGNAVKFTPKGEVELKISVTERNEGEAHYLFEVIDTGIGIDPDKQDKLFRAFFQGDSSTTRKYGGTGLGLVISGLLIEKMNSRIHLDSIPQRGSRFHFELVLPCEQGEKGDYKDFNRLHRILVVDDNENNRTILEDTLKLWGLEVHSCDGAVAALASIHGPTSFDLMIIDYHMPDYDGLQTIKMIRNKLGGSLNPPCIIYSSADDVFDKNTTNTNGISFQLFKPVKSKELYNYLRYLDEGHELNTTDGKKTHTTAVSLNGLQHSASILIAEDNITNLTLIKVLLKKIMPQVKVFEAKNGKEALDTALSESIDLILMDVQMPEMDGIEATKQIRAVETITKRHLPIVALTAGALIEERERCFDAGMDEFLTKPLDQDKLKLILSKLLAQEIESPEANLNAKSESPAKERRTVLSFDEAGLLQRVSNDRELMKDLIEISLAQFPSQIEQLREAVKSRNPEDIRRAAHAIKGSALNMSLNQLGELAKGMEKAELDMVEGYMESLENEWFNAKGLLESYTGE